MRCSTTPRNLLHVFIVMLIAIGLAKGRLLSNQREFAIDNDLQYNLEESFLNLALPNPRFKPTNPARILAASLTHHSDKTVIVIAAVHEHWVVGWFKDGHVERIIKEGEEVTWRNGVLRAREGDSVVMDCTLYVRGKDWSGVRFCLEDGANSGIGKVHEW